MESQGLGEFAGERMHAGTLPGPKFVLNFGGDEWAFNAIKMKYLRGQVLKHAVLINTLLHPYFDNPKW